MKFTKQHAEIIRPTDFSDVLQFLEKVGRNCYRSEENITPTSAEPFIRGIIKREHLAMIEHVTVSVQMVINRGISHEAVRHRLFSFAQSSTRYCNFSNDKFGHEIEVIIPTEWESYPEPARASWKESMLTAERSYLEMLSQGCTPQQARGVLPNDLRTDLIMTGNLRNWLWFFKLRTAPGAHPDMRDIAFKTQKLFQEKMPVIFGNPE